MGVMIYFYFIVFAIIIFSLQRIRANSFKGDNDLAELRREKDLRFCCALVAIALTLIAGLRHMIVGIDTGNYYVMFQNAEVMPWGEIFKIEEPGWHVIAKILHLLSADYQWMLVIVGLCYAVSISYFIYKKSEEPVVSYIMLISMMYFAFTISGQRQTIALSIIFFAYIFALERKYVKFFVLLLLAMFFHKSAIFAAPVIFISKKKLTDVSRVFYVAALPAIYALRRPIISIFQNFIYEGYTISQEEFPAWPTIILYFCIWLVFVFFGNHEKEEAPFYERMLMIGIVVQLFVPLQPTIFRVATYYQIASILIVPNFLRAEFFRKTRIIAYLIFLTIMLIMFFLFTIDYAGASPYYFFWRF